MATAIASDKDKMDKMNQSKSEYTLSASLKSFYTSSKFTDFTIQVADESFRVHKLIICGQSEYFSRMLNGEWKNHQETVEDVIELKDDLRIIEAIINFMYGLDYANSCRGLIPPTLYFAKLYAAAEFYGIPVLKDQAKTKFEDACWHEGDFCAVITELYTTTLPTYGTLCIILEQTITERIEAHMQRDG